MDILNIASKSALLPHREAIAQLFFDCFGQRALGAVWDWAYLDNPAGEPLVALIYEGDALVAHYAVVPMLLRRGGERRQACLSMTTMVAETHRRYGLFTQLAKAVYTMARDAGADFVMGFPNAQSTPGFRKRLDWQLPEPDCVARVTAGELASLAEAGGPLDRSRRFGFDMDDAGQRAWRMARPGGAYQWTDGLLCKEHEGALDVLWWRDAEALRRLPAGAEVNALVPAGAECGGQRLFDYQFGGLALCTDFDPAQISREMALSDLF